MPGLSGPDPPDGSSAHGYPGNGSAAGGVERSACPAPTTDPSIRRTAPSPRTSDVCGEGNGDAVATGCSPHSTVGRDRRLRRHGPRQPAGRDGPPRRPAAPRPTPCCDVFGCVLRQRAHRRRGHGRVAVMTDPPARISRWPTVEKLLRLQRTAMLASRVGTTTTGAVANDATRGASTPRRAVPSTSSNRCDRLAAAIDFLSSAAPLMQRRLSPWVACPLHGSVRDQRSE